ncbi:hypothetical protein NC653_034171 [Populus alba x Populus x berolinensis]|uniref:Uncharacterized protein n=1 Tax=Populus alba x Populus x berolinensis TaxID=444605 RepID=A0AAD6LNA9_9ROSI|nr:hypothetical protein NC653_034171 [Populus alba x Populus x berolinensis]
MLLSLVVKPVFASYHHFGSVSPVSVLEWIYIEVSILQHWEMPSHFDFRRTLPLSVHVLVIDSDIFQFSLSGMTRVLPSAQSTYHARPCVVCQDSQSPRILKMAEGAIAALNCSGAVLGSLPIRVSPSKTPVRPRIPRPPFN